MLTKALWGIFLRETLRTKIDANGTLINFVTHVGHCMTGTTRENERRKVMEERRWEGNRTFAYTDRKEMPTRDFAVEMARALRYR